MREVGRRRRSRQLPAKRPTSHPWIPGIWRAPCTRSLAHTTMIQTMVVEPSVILLEIVGIAATVRDGCGCGSTDRVGRVGLRDLRSRKRP